MLEILISIISLINLTQQTRFSNFLSFNDKSVISEVVYFFLRVYLLHNIFGVILYFIEKTFKEINIFLIATIFLIAKICEITFVYPQIFEDIKPISQFVGLLKDNTHFFIIFSTIAQVSILCYLLLVTIKPDKIKNFRIIIFGFIAAYSIGSILSKTALKNISFVNIENPKIASKTKANTIFLVTIDSLASDADFSKYSNKNLRKFIKNSLNFKNVITPIAQTHASLASIFTGKFPFEHGVRSNLSGQNTSVEENNQLLQDYKKKGYKLISIQDHHEYSNFQNLKFFDRSYVPEYSFANVVISNIFKSKFIYSIFNNAIGRYILPEIKNNSSFTYGYDLSEFSEFVKDTINREMEDNELKLFYIHTCAMHWPSVLPYPYYKTNNKSNLLESSFSYENKFRALAVPQFSSTEWVAQAKFNKELYNNGIKYVVEKFLNPIFSYLDSKNYLNNSIVALISDHGEDAWDKNSKFPYVKRVQHGGTLLFGSTSEWSYFKIIFPNYNGNFSNINFSLHRTLNLIFDNISSSNNFASNDFFDKEKLIYSETGLWLAKNFSNQFVPIFDLSSQSLLRINSANKVEVNKFYEKYIIYAKQRSIYFEHFKLTRFLSDQGIHYFLCDFESDPGCILNTSIKNIHLFNFLKTKIELVVDEDFKKNNIHLFNCESASFSKELEGDSLWIDFHQSVICINQEKNISEAIRYQEKIFKKMAENENIFSLSLFDKIASFQIDLCSENLLLSNKLNNNFIDRMIKIKIKISSINFNSENFESKKILNCIDNLKLENFKKLTIEILSKSEKSSKFFTSNESIIFNQFKNATFLNIDLLDESFLKIKSQNFSSKIMEDFNLEYMYKKFILNSGSNLMEIRTLLDVEFNYNLVGELQRYFAETRINFYNVEPEKSAHLMVNDLVTKAPISLNFKYLYYGLLFKYFKISQLNFSAEGIAMKEKIFSLYRNKFCKSELKKASIIDNCTRLLSVVR